MASVQNDAGSQPDTSDTRPLRPSQEDIPPPCYSNRYEEMDIHNNDFGTSARIADDGRVNINIKDKGHKLTSLLAPTTYPSKDTLAKQASLAPSVSAAEGFPVPRMNIVIHIVGSRGDVQPFIALGRSLKSKAGHRIRIATHPVFKDFVEENGLEFFSIGGDPSQLMAFMVKNPGLMPGFDSLRNGDVGKRRKDITEIISGCWRSCFEAGDGTGIPIADLDSLTRCMGDTQPFVADAIIANPPSFAHIHCAEKLGIPLHLMFTMPWSPTQAFPHPLVNIQFTNADKGVANFVSYALIEMLTWQGLGDIINRFREQSLGLEPIGIMWAPGMIPRLKVPFTYCWSPTLLPKPKDWGNNINIAGFYFLEKASTYTPPQDLERFLADGPPPIYIGFGSIVIDDPDGMTQLLFDAVKQSGQRALISKGWGGIGVDELEVPNDILMIGSSPHDWLFERVSCVVHHGGAGTTAAGIACGKPTVIVPFFGDQPFWGSIVSKAGAGPPPIPHKQLTAEKLAAGIKSALEPGMCIKARELGQKVREEPSLERGIDSFHKQLHSINLRCLLSPSRPAVWRVKRTKIRLSAFAVTLLMNEGILDVRDLKLFRSKEYDLEPGPRDPISGGAAALVGSLVDFTIGFADFPARVLERLPLPRGALPPEEKKSSKTSAPVDSPARRPSPQRSVASGRNSPELSDATRSSNTVLEPAADNASILSTESKTKAAVSEASKVTVDEVLGVGMTASKLVSIGIKSPMNFALSVAKGFHNAPKLYGDDSVREQEKITGFQSGLRAAGKEFGYGFYDGISGLVTQPLRGAKKGPMGVVKGIGKGIGGLVLKPGAGIFGLAGYPLTGIQKEVQKLWSTSVECYIVACRTKQGYDEWMSSSEEEKDESIRRWYMLGADLEAKAAHSPFAAEWESLVRILFDSGRNHEAYHKIQGVTGDPAGIEKMKPDHFKESIRSATHLLSSLVNRYKNEPVHSIGNRKAAVPESFDFEFPEDEEQQGMIELALHASINELEVAHACGDHQNAGDRAVRACVKEAQRIQEEKGKRLSAAGDEADEPESPRSEMAGKENKGKAQQKKQKLTKDGLDAVAEYAIWKTLTEKRKILNEDSSESNLPEQQGSA